MIRNGGDGNSELGSILIDKARYYPAQGRIDFIADATATPAVTARSNVASPSTTEWFKFRYEVDYQTQTASIYINDAFKASQKYGGKYPADYLTNGTLRFYIEPTASSSLPSALFVDDVKIYSPGNDKTLAIATTIPQDNGQNVPINQPITINFNKPVNSTTLNTIKVTGEGDVTPQTNSQISYDPIHAVTSVTVILQNNLEYPKKYTVDLSGVLDIDGNNIVTSNQQFSFTTDSQGMLLLRYEDFEDYNTGNIWLPTKVANANPPKKTENGTVYSIHSQTPKLTGGIDFNASKTGSEINLIQTTDNNGNTIKALQSLNTDNIEGYSTQIELNGTFDLNGAKRYIYKARVRGGNGGNELAYYTSIGNSRIYYGTMLSVLGGENTDGEKKYYEVIPTNGTWFDIKYEIDLVNKIALIYINDNLVATQIMPENMALPSNSYMKLQDYTLGRIDATYIDKIEVYAYKEASNSYPTVPTFLKNDAMVDKLNNTNLSTISGQTYYINKDTTKNISVVFCLYYNEKLVSMQVDTKEVEKDVRTAFNCSFTPPATTQANYQIKTLFLDNIANLKPLYTSYSITKTECSWK
jgi:hypothetical protein